MSVPQANYDLFGRIQPDSYIRIQKHTVSTEATWVVCLALTSIGRFANPVAGLRLKARNRGSIGTGGGAPSLTDPSRLRVSGDDFSFALMGTAPIRPYRYESSGSRSAMS